MFDAALVNVSRCGNPEVVSACEAVAQGLIKLEILAFDSYSLEESSVHAAIVDFVRAVGKSLANV